MAKIKPDTELLVYRGKNKDPSYPVKVLDIITGIEEDVNPDDPDHPKHNPNINPNINPNTNPKSPKSNPNIS